MGSSTKELNDLRGGAKFMLDKTINFVGPDCEGAGELVNAREPAHRARPKAEDSAKEREKFVKKRMNIDNYN